MAKIQEQIEKKLKEQFKPDVLRLENESHMHSVPKNSETHFRLLLVSSVFEGLNRVQRQQKVYESLKDEMQFGVHALSQRVYTPKEWQERGEEDFVASPNCSSKRV